MATFTTRDGVTLYYKDWGTGQPIVFSHGYPLTSDAFEDQMSFLAGRGYRCIAHDRRGHGRSSQPWDGNTMDSYADDLSQLIESLDLQKATLVGHSTGGGEVARYIGRKGTKRVARVVLISAVTPFLAQTGSNPHGAPKEIFDKMRADFARDRSQWCKDLSLPFFGANRSGSKVSQGLRDSFWMQGMMGGYASLYDCIAAFSETDFTADLKRIDVPALVLHGRDDQIVPLEISGALSAKLIPDAKLVVLDGQPHGICSTDKDRVNAELLAFITGAATTNGKTLVGAGASKN